MPSNTERRPKIPAQRSSDIYYTQLHLQNPHLYPSSNPYSLPPREDFLSYSPPTNPRPAAPTTRPDHAPPPVQKRSSSPSDAALFWSFVSRQIQKQKAKLRAKKAQATTSSASGPISRPIPIVYPSSTSTLPPPTSPQPHSLFHAYRRQQKEKKARARKALISAPLKGGVTVVRTDSGNEYSFPEPRVEGGVVRVLMGRGGTKKGRGVVMPMASSKVAGLRELEKRASRRMPSGAEVVGLGIDLGDGKLGPRRVKGERITRWGDFLGKSSEERESERRKAKPSAPTAKTAGDTYGGRNERCRICHEMQNPNPKTARSRSSGVCARCQSEYSSPYTPPFSTTDKDSDSDAIPPIPHLKDSRLYTKPSPRPATPSTTTSTHPASDSLFADFDSSSDLHTHPKYQLSPFDFESQPQSYDSRRLALSPDRQTLLLSTTTAVGPHTTAATKRRGAVSAASPTSQTYSQRQRVTVPTAPPIPDDDEYMSRKYGASLKRKGGKDDKRRSSFYNFWDEVLAGSRTSLAARRGYDVL